MIVLIDFPPIIVILEMRIFTPWLESYS